MKRALTWSVLLLAGFLAWFRPSGSASNSSRQAAAPVLQAQEKASLREPIKPVPFDLEADGAKVELGRKLFHDARLSGDRTVSCASCHDLSKGGTDRRARSLGAGGSEGVINAPTVFNSAFNFKQFWDGRAATLEEQIDGPIHQPAEMNSSWPAIVAKLQADPQYASAFARLYPGGICAESVKDAIVQFERSLVTPDARFDRYLRGDSQALTPDEKEGYRKFKVYGCISCHQGVNVGGNLFETLGTMSDYFAERGNLTRADYGRYNVTGREEDRFVFKVPGLRNVALTPPYFHDGSVKTLEKAVSLMARHQLGRELSTEDTAQIVQFLETLTGEYEGRRL